MPYVTLIKSSNGKFDVELPSLISNVSQVGLVDFSFDSKKIDYLKVSNDDLRAHFEYDPKRDDLTKFGKSNIPWHQLAAFERIFTSNARLRGEPTNEILAYSNLKYELRGEAEPWAEFTMYQYGGNKTIHSEKISLEIFKRPFATAEHFNIEILYTKWDNKLAQPDRGYGAFFSHQSGRISIINKTFWVYIYVDIPRIDLKCNESAKRILGLTEYMGESPWNLPNGTWLYEFKRTFSVQMKLPDTSLQEIKKIMMESKYGKKNYRMM